MVGYEPTTANLSCKDRGIKDRKKDKRMEGRKEGMKKEGRKDGKKERERVVRLTYNAEDTDSQGQTIWALGLGAITLTLSLPL